MFSFSIRFKKISFSQKRGLEEGELPPESKKNKTRSERRRSAEDKGFGEGYAQGFEEGRKAAEATAVEEGRQVSKAEVAALKQRIESLTAQFDYEVRRADNLQHQLDVARSLSKLQYSPLESETPRQEHGSDKNSNF